MQPEDVLPGDIDANLGAPWIPESDIQAFAAELFSCPPEAITIPHIKKDAAWSVEAGYAAQALRRRHHRLRHVPHQRHDAVRAGIEHENADHLRPRPGRPAKRRVVNQEETLAAREKQKLIKERFKSWIFSDPDRAERLVRIYNDTYNNLRPTAVRRLAPGLSGNEPGLPAPPAPERRRLAGDEQRQYAAGPLRRGRQVRTSWPPPA